MDKPDPHKLEELLSEILSRRTGVKIRVTIVK